MKGILKHLSSSISSRHTRHSTEVRSSELILHSRLPIQQAQTSHGARNPHQMAGNKALVRQNNSTLLILDLMEKARKVAQSSEVI